MITRTLTAAALALGLSGPASAQDWTDPWKDGQATELQEQQQRQERIGQFIAGAAILGIAALAYREHRDREEEARGPDPLPALCLRRVATQGGMVRLYDGDCLTEHYDDAADLPLSCGRIVHGPEGGFSSGFVPSCLRDNGYEVADRR